MRRRLGFLSGGPRISTHPEARDTAARAHILGVIRTFEMLGWEVKPFIAGNRVPKQWIRSAPEQAIRSRTLLTLAADFVYVISSAVNTWRAWRKLGGQVDCVYERQSAFGLLGWAFRRHGVPWILETNGPIFYEIKTKTTRVLLSDLACRLEIKAYRECDMIVCISETLKEIIVREIDVPPAKVVVIHNAVDPAVFDPDKHEPIRIFDGFTVGYVGSLNPWQGLQLLIEALSELEADGLRVYAVVVGDGGKRVALEALARRLGVSERVAFIGRVRWQEVPRYIGGFDLGYSGQVQMGEREMYHSPMKLYEYMAMAKPVIASDFEATRQMVRDEETGFLFRMGSKEDLKRALTRAYEARNELYEMGSKARREVVSKHNWQARVHRIISAIENCP
jgi:glycosyltransferase involved in cell wall biosynthesis